MNLQHPAVLEHGEGWIKFKDLEPNTLEEILPIGEVTLTSIEVQKDKVYFVMFAKQLSES